MQQVVIRNAPIKKKNKKQFPWRQLLPLKRQCLQSTATLYCISGSQHQAWEATAPFLFKSSLVPGTQRHLSRGSLSRVGGDHPCRTCLSVQRSAIHIKLGNLLQILQTPLYRLQIPLFFSSNGRESDLLPSRTVSLKNEVSFKPRPQSSQKNFKKACSSCKGSVVCNCLALDAFTHSLAPALQLSLNQCCPALETLPPLAPASTHS